MSISKRVAYLRGLAEGLGIGEGTKEERVLNVIIDILDDIALEVEDLQEDVLALDEDISELCEDMEDLEDVVFDEDEEDLDEMGEDDAPLFFEIRCPGCKNEITVDEDVLGLGVIDCPSCGEKLEFDMDDFGGDE